MAAPVSSRGVTNLLDYKPDPDVISQAAWKADAALTFHKLLNNLQRAAVRIQGSRPGIMLTCIVSFMAIAPIVSEREGLQ